MRDSTVCRNYIVGTVFNAVFTTVFFVNRSNLKEQKDDFIIEACTVKSIFVQ